MRRGRRRSLPGNAMIEFLLTLPIILFLTGLTIYMSMAMLTKQRTIIEAYHSVYRIRWWYPAPNYSPSYDGSGAGEEHRPRGTGESLERLRQDVQAETIQQVSSALARNYWTRLFGNLPGRDEQEESRSFETQGSLWNFIPKTAVSDHFRDQSEWRFFDLDTWKIARSGPLNVIYQSFWDNLQGDVAPHFQKTRDEIIERWWHGHDELKRMQPNEND